jgi:L-ribulokinase
MTANATAGEGATGHPTGSRPAYVVGVDFGTLSGRAVVLDAADGRVLGSAVSEYAHAVISDHLPADLAGDAAAGRQLPPDWALQAPDDYREVLRTAVPAALVAAGVDPGDVVGIATDFTASTPMPTTADGTPLCEVEGFTDRPHAWVKLWRHHAAQPQADRVNAVAAERGETWPARYGGKISSEWEWAKALQILQEDPAVWAAVDRWIEAGDWIVWQLTGVESRSVCIAGYKGIHQDGDWPSREFAAALDPDFADFVDTRLRFELSELGSRVGGLSEEAAGWTGLPPGIAVATGNVDAHVSAPAALATAPGVMLAIMGTSTCHVMNSESLVEVPGMCGVVEGGITPGLFGYEAGQSGVGDILGWFVDHEVPASYRDTAAERGISVHTLLSELGAAQEVGEHGLIALDWHSGNRSILVDSELSGVIVGQTLATTAVDTYRALVEATAYGTRRIIDSFTESGVAVEEFVATGGLLRNPFLMQVYADVLNRPISLLESEIGPALGSGIQAAVAAGVYPDIAAASAAMGAKTPAAYTPDPDRAKAYDALYAEYRELYAYFGQGGNEVMHRLRAIRRAARLRAGKQE